GNGNVKNSTYLVDNTKSKNITAYNILNLPQTGTAAGTAFTYTYDATGQKLRKVAGTATTDYIDGIQYTGTTTTDPSISFIQTEEGRAVNNGTGYDYEYTLADHLGNSRVNFSTASGSAAATQVDDYYAFGMDISRTPPTPVLKNEYLYNKKELQEELNQYDYGARFYDPVIARWLVVDPMAEVGMMFSPYNYALNNPIRNIDIDGMVDESAIDNSNPGFEAQHFEDILERDKRYANGGAYNDDNDGPGDGGGKRQESSAFSRYVSALWTNLSLYNFGDQVTQKWNDWLDDPFGSIYHGFGDALSTSYHRQQTIFSPIKWGPAINEDVDAINSYIKLPAEQKAKTDAARINNFIVGIGASAPLAEFTGLAGSAVKNALKTGLNGGLGYSFNIRNYNIGIGYTYETQELGSTLFSIKQNKIGGNLLRWDYGKLHLGYKQNMGFHSTFRFNLGESIYGSTKQYSPFAPFNFWRYKRK
ncbi:MAG TPA: RHS repeat-associated core domain-containing protein, partial [Mucilaginibacter sp.]|nr:RHS repeat-associated core domain-containing protein [Mucilaginibacter sp.]